MREGRVEKGSEGNGREKKGKVGMEGMEIKVFYASMLYAGG